MFLICKQGNNFLTDSCFNSLTHEAMGGPYYHPREAPKGILSYQDQLFLQ